MPSYYPYPSNPLPPNSRPLFNPSDLNRVPTFLRNNNDAKNYAEIQSLTSEVSPMDNLVQIASKTYNQAIASKKSALEATNLAWEAVVNKYPRAIIMLLGYIKDLKNLEAIHPPYEDNLSERYAEIADKVNQH